MASKSASNDPLIAGVLSFLVPGLGHWLINKKGKKGLVLFVVAFPVWFIGLLTLGLLYLLYMLFCAYDAYMENQGKPVWKFE